MSNVNNLDDAPGIPEGCDLTKQGIWDYLHRIRRTTKVNMFGAAPILVDHLGLPKKIADEWVLYFLSQWLSLALS